MSRTMSTCRSVRGGPTCLSLEHASGWYGSRTGADDLWVLPKLVVVPSGGQPSLPRDTGEDYRDIVRASTFIGQVYQTTTCRRDPRLGRQHTRDLSAGDDVRQAIGAQNQDVRFLYSLARHGDAHLRRRPQGL